MAPERACQVIEELYPDVMHEVIQACIVDFEDAGVSPRILDDLKSLWEKHLTESGVARFPWDPTPPPVEPTKPDGPLRIPTLHLDSLQRSCPIPIVLPFGLAPLQYSVAAQAYDPSYMPPARNHVGNGSRDMIAYHQQARAPMGNPHIVDNQLARAPVGLTPLQRYQMQLGMPTHNLEVARERALEHVKQQQHVQQQQYVQQQHAQQQQHVQQRIAGMQTTLEGIERVINNHPAALPQQGTYGRDAPDLRLNRPGSQDVHFPGSATNPLAVTLPTPQAQPPSITHTQPKQPSPYRKPPPHPHSKYGPSPSYPYPSASPYQGNPPPSSGLSQLDGSTDSRAPSLVPETVAPLGEIDNKELDDADDDISPGDGEEEFEEVPELMVCLYDKVAKVRNKSTHKWRCLLRDGVLVADGKEYVFVKATAELVW